MSLVQMGEKMETVKFFDEFDLTLSLDNRSSASHEMMNLELFSKPIVIRASYRDINLIMAILNKAFERLGSSNSKRDTPAQAGGAKQSQKTTIMSRSTRSKERPVGKARVRMTKQQVNSHTL